MAEGPARGNGYRRGRGYSFRGGPNQVLNRLGVTDLREHLINKKRDDKSQGESSSPSGSPSRVARAGEQQDGNQRSDKPANSVKSNKPSETLPRGERRVCFKSRGQAEANVEQKGETRPQQPSPTRPKQTPRVSKDIENPLNIKVEFSPSTGERTYAFDESSVLPTIKHVPDQRVRLRGGFRGRGFFSNRNFTRKPIENSSETGSGNAHVQDDIVVEVNNKAEGSGESTPNVSDQSAQRGGFRGNFRANRGRGFHNRNYTRKPNENPNKTDSKSILIPDENWIIDDLNEGKNNVGKSEDGNSKSEAMKNELQGGTSEDNK